MKIKQCGVGLVVAHMTKDPSVATGHFCHDGHWPKDAWQGIARNRRQPWRFAILNWRQSTYFQTGSWWATVDWKGHCPTRLGCESTRQDRNEGLPPCVSRSPQLLSNFTSLLFCLPTGPKQKTIHYFSLHHHDLLSLRPRDSLTLGVGGGGNHNDLLCRLWL